MFPLIKILYIFQIPTTPTGFVPASELNANDEKHHRYFKQLKSRQAQGILAGTAGYKLAPDIYYKLPFLKILRGILMSM